MMRVKDEQKRVSVALLTHPFELSFAFLFLVIGISLAARGHVIRLSSMQALPVALVVGWELCLLLGGPLIAAGLLWRGSELMGRAVERSGLYLAAAAWSTYALTVGALVGWHAAVAVAQGVAISGCCLLRAYALRRVDRVASRAIREDGDR